MPFSTYSTAFSFLVSSGRFTHIRFAARFRANTPQHGVPSAARKALSPQSTPAAAARRWGYIEKTASQKRQKRRAENEIAKPKCIFAPRAMQERFCISPRHSLFPAHENAASVYKRPVFRKSAPSPDADAAQRRRAVGTGGKYKPLRFFSLANKTGTRARSNRYLSPKKAASFSYKIPFLKMVSNFVGRTAPNRTRTMCRAYGARRQPALLPF